jgi:hypothetical protein
MVLLVVPPPVPAAAAATGGATAAATTAAAATTTSLPAVRILGASSSLRRVGRVVAQIRHGAQPHGTRVAHPREHVDAGRVVSKPCFMQACHTGAR